MKEASMVEIARVVERVINEMEIVATQPNYAVPLRNVFATYLQEYFLIYPRDDAPR